MIRKYLSPDSSAAPAADNAATASDTSSQAAAPAPDTPPKPLPVRMTLLANRDIQWGEVTYPEGTEMGRITLPPGVPYGLRFLTRLIEDCGVIQGPPPTN